MLISSGSIVLSLFYQIGLILPFFVLLILVFSTQSIHFFKVFDICVYQFILTEQKIAYLE